MKKKILFIITQSEFGGAQRFLSTFVPHLEPDKYEVLVATGSTGDQHFPEHLQNLNIANTTLKNLVREISILKDIKAVKEIRELIAKFQPDTLFLLSTKAGFLGSYASLKFKSLKLKVIYRIGGWAFNDPQSALRRRMIIWAEKISARWKDIIIVNNKHDFDQARELGIKPRKDLVLIYNGIDVYKMRLYDRQTAREKLGIPQNVFVAGTIAHDYQSKGLKYLPKENGYKQIVLSKVKNASRYLSAFDVYVSPSVKEGFSWAVLEAMAAKIPVIATRVGAAPEMVEDGKNGYLVEPRHPEQIADRILRLMRDDKTRQNFGIEGHQTALKRFDLSRSLKSLGELL